MSRKATRDEVESVLMTTDCVGGVWTYALELSRGLAREGVEVTLATLGPLPTADQRAQAEAIPGLRLVESDYALEWMDEPWTEVEEAGRWLLALEDRFNPDLVHLNHFSYGNLPFHRAPLVVAHSCIASWFEAVKGEALPERYERYHTHVRRGLRAAGEVVAPSRAMLEAVERHYGELRHTRVIHNGRNPGEYRPAKKLPFVLAAGRLWDEAKNVAALAKVASRLPWPVRLAGSNQHPSGRKQSLPGVELLGRLEPAALAKEMGHASIYALPARYEPFGLSALEAALAGCALVLGDIPSLREVWGEAAVFVPPDDPEALERAVRGLIEDDTGRALRAVRARERARQFSTGRMVARYLQVYDELLVREQGEPGLSLAKVEERA